MFDFMNSLSIENLAKDINARIAMLTALTAHTGQKRKWEESNKPYIVHPIRVASTFEWGSDEWVVAILHDVVEDTEITLQHLAELGFRQHILDGIDSVTKRDGEAYFDFVNRSKKDPIGIQVKIADILDNSKTIPEGHSLHERYAKALKILEA